MSPRWKMFLIHAVIFAAVFILVRFVMTQFAVDPTFWTTVIPLGCAWLLSPKPHVESTQSGKQYGLKSIFSKKIIRF
ncbi:hypothetical protein [Nonlabens sp.]|uniref:hypothetical protein n=1 Tax=Nonlabens sp. TaxID=1888209 RepID=UPI003F698601